MKYSPLLFLLPICLFAEGPEPLLPPKNPPEIIKKEPASGDAGSIVKDTTQKEPFIGPWLTGPLLCPSAHTIPGGHYNLEPYLFINDNIGYFNNHWHLEKFSEPRNNINVQFVTQMGINSWWDFEFVPQFFYTYYENEDAWRFGDLLMATGFQILDQNDAKGIPALKFQVGEVLPTGYYQNLSADKLGTDASGGGTFTTKFDLIVSRLWHFGGSHFLAARWQVGCAFPSGVRVHGINAYGGDATTIGRVVPGKAFSTILGLEYTMLEKWALAVDIANHVTGNTVFKGTTVQPVGNNNVTYQLSLAPAIEYNATPQVGVIAGVWFTLVGINSPTFANGVVAINYYI